MWRFALCGGRGSPRYRLSKDCTVEVVFSGAITQSAIDKLRAHLDLSKDAYPENGEIN